VYAFVNAGWRRHAACAGETTMNWWPDQNLQRYPRYFASPTALLPLLICETCPVRRPCLGEGLTRWPAPMRELDPQHPSYLDVRAVGTWGGTFDLDR
jgi:hypothetical protein